MKCFNHTDMDATATCQSCNKGLCVECSSRFDMMLCEPCLLAHNKSVAQEMYTGLAITATILLGFAFFMGTRETSTGESLGVINALLPGLFLAFSYWGWKFLSDHLPFLTMATGTVWLIYFMFKFFLAYFIGLIVGPYQIYKMFKEINSVKKTKKQIERGDI